MTEKLNFGEDKGQRFDNVELDLEDHAHPDPVDQEHLKSSDQGADYKGDNASGSEETSYYTGNEMRLHEDKGTPNEILEIDKEIKNLRVSSGEKLEASAPFGDVEKENVSENQEVPCVSGQDLAPEVSSKDLYCSSSNSLFGYDHAEWKLDEQTFLKYADEQCRNNPEKCRRVTQGLIYNKEMSPTSQEYRKGEEWKLGEWLGSGTFGDVYKCESLLTRAYPYAVKKVPTTNPDGWVRLEEIDLWQKLGHHRNVCELYGVTFEEGAFWFHMELVQFAEHPAKNVPKYLSTLKTSAQIPVKGLLTAGGGLFKGIDHMHKQEITHRDMKHGKNVMVSTGLNLKIIDFSFIRTATEDKHFDKDLKGGLACFFQLVTGKKKDPDNWTDDAVKDCIKDHDDVEMLLPLCQTLISHLKYDSGDADKVAGWMAWEINRRLANLLLEKTEIKP
ncbi:uncharacterized protein [Branchiostoma lanceolatum]|uniref:uncharacterized protein n=1 Tax=Branchiostoma lanceolatum TaxID=7740 RepID=UPI0034540C54